MGKLVRDNLPEIARAKGQTYNVTVANAEEYAAALRKKLIEEAHEYVSAPEPMELADIAEVLRALAKQHNLTWEQIEEPRTKKAAERGAFDKRLIWDGKK